MACEMEDRTSVHTLYKPGEASDNMEMSSDVDCGALCHGATKPTQEFWLHSMLRTHFFTPCASHREFKKNEATHFCVDCGSGCTSLCAHCLPDHTGHRLIQIRRYVYCDVIRATDMAPYVDIQGIQTYIINQAKVIFLNPRPHSKLANPGATDACLTCSRCLRDGCSFCSLACKVEALVAEGKICMPAGGAASDSSDFCQMPLGSAAAAHDTDGEHQGPHLHSRQQQHLHHLQQQQCRRRSSADGGPTSTGSLRSSTDGGGSDSDTHCRSGSSLCSRRKQLSPRRSPYL